MSLPEAALQQRPVLALVGPTASGKSALAIEVAERMRLEIVAIDSMTIYRGMDIGTAKPSAADRARVPHHLLDIADPTRPYNVSQFQRAARAAIADVHARNRVPLCVGGSGLYFRSVVDELEFPPADAEVRSRLESEDPATLRRKLAHYDAGAAETIDPANVRRIVRALEVIEITGTPFSAFRTSWDRYESRYALTVAGLAGSTQDRGEAIAARVHAMFAQGLVEEVRGLLEQGLRRSLTASRAIAYREVVAFLDGELGLPEAIEQIIEATRRYARRQMIWFRKDPRVTWMQEPSVDQACEHFARALGEAPARNRNDARAHLE